MALSTFSTFYYGHNVTSDNQYINFDEGSGDIAATIAVGSYTPTDFATAIQTAMNAAGTYTYTVTFDRDDRTITIASSSGNFSLLASSGDNVDFGAWTLMGFAATDVSGSSSYTGGSASGSQYSPQFKLQDYISSSDWRQASSATVNKTASGRVEVIKFGDEQFIQANIKYVNNYTQPDNNVIKNSATGVADLRTFMQYIINKRPFEFIPDIDTPSTYEEVLLESSPGFKDGTGYKLRELYDQGLAGYYETGPLVFRVVD